MRRRMSADGMSMVEDSLMVDEEARRGVEEEEESWCVVPRTLVLVILNCPLCKLSLPMS